MSRNNGVDTTKNDPAIKRGRGRPANFDRPTALKNAMHLFWERGYEGTSFEDLIHAMGISASTFYNSFGNKEQLYREVTELFMATAANWFSGVLNEPADTRSVFGKLFQVIADRFTDPELPSGCMISLAGTHVPPGLNTVRSMMCNYRAATEEALLARLQRGLDEGDLPPDTDIEALAAFYNAMLRGMAVQARDGASRDKLAGIVRTAMQAWPGQPVPESTKRKQS